MKKECTVFNFSGIYEKESFYRKDKGSLLCDDLIDCTGISGTNCMCDDAARDQIRNIIRENSVSFDGIHFIDSGNYHYMSAILTEEVKEPFSLVVLDHHPDMQPPMFGDILSCGAWVLDVINKNEYVRDVHVIGADRNLIAQLDEEDRKRVKFYDLNQIHLLSTEYPVYLSIDKDVLSREELITNWDQGDMTADEMYAFVKKLVGEREIIGVDVCGECALDQEGISVDEAIAGNDRFNEKICEVIWG